jgi:drug/metabolite transporter (DMT)-like permease
LKGRAGSVIALQLKSRLGLSWSRRAWHSPYLLLALTTLLWGGNTIASRIAVGNISPMALSSLRWVGVALIFPVIFRQELVAYWPTIRSNWLQIAMMGALGFTAFNALLYLAAHDTTAINIGIIQGAIPALVMAGGWIVLRTPLSLVQMIGLVFTMAGVLVVALKGDVTTLAQLAINRGDLFMLLACSLYAGYTLALRRRPALPNLVFFTCVAVVACVFSLGLFGWEVAVGAAQWPNWTGWLIVLYVTLGPSIAAQLMFIRGVDLIGPARAGLFVNLIPIWSAVLGVLILGEAFAVYHAVALLFVLGGIWIAEQRAT